MDVFVYLHIKIKIQTHFQSLFVFKNSQIPEITSLTLVVYFAKVKILLCIHDVLGLSLVFLLNVASKWNICNQGTALFVAHDRFTADFLVLPHYCALQGVF